MRDAVLAFAKRHDFEEGHSLQDERLALQLFDETARLGLHRMDEVPLDVDKSLTPREILSCAALLHDIGYVEGYENHHKTSFKLITGEKIPGLSKHDRLLVALVARYHRGATPDPDKHEGYATLPPEEQHVVARLGAILRFADGLDRSHTDAVQEIELCLEGSRLTVTLKPGTDDETERLAGQKKAHWFESQFRVRVELR
jgi:exopolyphosphatase / guanosine-5'-triphosphate,3'-diphosphate pyrophosphatase